MKTLSRLSASIRLGQRSLETRPKNHQECVLRKKVLWPFLWLELRSDKRETETNLSFDVTLWGGALSKFNQSTLGSFSED